MKSEAGPPLCNTPSYPLPEVKITLVTRPLLTQVTQKLFNCKHGVFRTCICSQILLHLKSSAALHEIFRNAYPKNDVPNMTIHQMLPNFQDTGSVCL